MLQVMERRLAAILSIDVVGYSRLMGADEGGTLAALRSCREQLIEPKVAQHHGRTIKLMGDGALMEFTSIVDAVLFAVDVQCAMRERNSNVPEDRRLVFRIGINLGDVIAEGADIYGDGVNIAARLEAIAEPGGICVSSAVCNQVRDKLALDFEDKGESKVKNIDRPLHVFRLVLNGKADALATPVPTSRPTAVRRWRIVAITAALAAVVSVAGVVWWRTSSPRLERASVEHMAYPLPDRPSIAVLPFNNLTGDPKQAHAADGMTETLITTLARIPDLFVIARNSSSVYKGKAVKVQNVAEELGVRYVLEGSVQQADGKVRVIVQLIDALRGQHLWAETYDRSIEDLFKLQDEIALKTTVALQIKLTTGEEARILSRETNNVQAWILYQQAESAIFRFDREGMRDARAC